LTPEIGVGTTGHDDEERFANPEAEFEEGKVKSRELGDVARGI
jgi:hypothetical protein